MPIERVDPGWSPTKAKLNRRRQKATKIQLDLSSHIKGGPNLDDSFGALNNNSPKSKSKKLEDSCSSLDAAALEAAVSNLNPHQKKLLATIQDKSQPVRDRVQAEVELSKDPNASQIMKDVKYSGGRKSALQFKAKTEAEEIKLMNEFISLEEKREAEEKKEFAKARRQRKAEEQAKKDREAKAIKDAQTQAAKQKIQDAVELRNLALKTQKTVEKNVETKTKREKEEEEARDVLKNDLLQYEDNDVIRTLKEARIDQKEIQSNAS